MLDFRNIFRALRNRNYRLFFTGQSLSLVGTWMQQIALSWLVYRMTHSPLLLGVVGFAGQVPAFFISPVAGIIADRYPKRKALVLTQALSMLQASLLAFLVLSNQIAIWHIVVLSIFLGIVNGFDMSIRQAFTIEMVDNKEDLSNAIALNSSIVNLARLIGPSIAGILIATVGEGLCFLVNALSYGPVVFCLLAMQIRPSNAQHKRFNFLTELRTGFVYVTHFAPIWHILLLLGIVSFLGTPYQILMPIFARDIFLGGPQTLSLLVAMAGAGALTGAVYLASRKSIVGLGKMIAISSGMFGVGLVAFSFSRVFWFSLSIVFMAGFFMMVQMAASNTILQTISDEDKRGRVMSFYAMAFMGMVPFGSLVAGSLASKIGAPWTLCLGGACCILGSLGFAMKLPELRKIIRPIYVKKGIIPEVVQGIQSASG
ncbi:MAG: MFS transporter [Candidatus Omnitrophota bacterium]